MVTPPRTVTSRIPFHCAKPKRVPPQHSALAHKVPNTLSDETVVVLKRKVTGINQVQFCVREVSSVRLSTFDGEERIVLALENQHSRLSVAEVLMPASIKRDVRPIVVKQIQQIEAFPGRSRKYWSTV